MSNWSDENTMAAVRAEPDSPYIDKLRQYVDAQRSVERATEECSRLDKHIAETRSKMSALRAELQEYLAE